MAIVTQSAATCQNAPRFVSRGVFGQLFRYEYNGVSLSVSDLVFMGYIPQGVTVLGAWIWGSDSSGANTWKIGTGTTDNALSTAVTMSASGFNWNLGCPPKAFSLSNDAEGNLRIPVTVTKASGTSTVTGSINLFLLMMAPPT